MSAVALATCLATFLLNWSLNLGDKIQRELRAYGSNIIIAPRGDSLPIVTDHEEAGMIITDQYLKQTDIDRIEKTFWKNQILTMVPLLQQSVYFEQSPVMLVGAEFGDADPIRSYPKIAPYLQLQGIWPKGPTDLVCGIMLCKQFGWQPGGRIVLHHSGTKQEFTVTGTVSSGGIEDKQLFANLKTVQHRVCPFSSR